MHDRSAWAHERDRVGPRLLRAGGLDHDVGAAARRRARRRRHPRAPGAPSRPPTITGQPPASATHAASISPIGPAPRIATVSPALDARALDATQAAGERLDHRSDLGRRGRSGTSCRLTDRRCARARRSSPRTHRRNTSSRHCSPRSQPAQLPQGALLAATTRRPSTRPQNSCPKGDGDSTASSGWPRRNVFRSVPSVSASSIWTSSRRRPGTGLRHLLDPQVAGAYSRAAFTV